MKRISLIMLCLLCLCAYCAQAEDGVFILPVRLANIEAETFAGIGTQAVQVPEAVQTIGDRAFADCARLREIHIPATVTAIANSALEGCGSVTVYGVAGTEAQRFANANGFGFVDTAAPAIEKKDAAVSMPFVPAL